MTQVLITGASGFIGRHLVDEFQRRDVSYVCLSRSAGEDLARDDFSLKGGPFSSVYHLAGRAHRIPRTASEAREFIEINFEGTRRLVRALEDIGLPENFIFASTVSVYGKESGDLLSEEEDRVAHDPYGLSKKLAEDFLLDWANRKKVSLTIFRLAVVVGKNTPGHFGKMVGALKKGIYFRIGNGEARRSLVFAADVAKAMLDNQGHSGIFHLTDGNPYSFSEIEAALSKSFSRPLPPKLPLFMAKTGAWLGDRVRLPLNSRVLRNMTHTLSFSDKKARQELKWNPRSVIDNIEDTIA